MNKKAFTLIELLAVIIVLGVLAVLIAPKVVNMLDEAEKNTYMSSAEGIVKAATYKYSNNDVVGKTNETITIDYGTRTNTDYLEYSGDKPESGQVIITSDGRVALAVKFKDYCYSKNYDSDKIISNLYDAETCAINGLLENKTYTSGDAVTDYGGYSWHVISDDGENVTLLMDAGESGNLKLPADPKGKLSGGKMRHCTADDLASTDCGVGIEGEKSSYVYSWEKSLIQTYLNTTFYNELKSEIGNEIVPATICNDPSPEHYGGYLQSEIENTDGVCNSYSDYNIRLITMSEYYNLSPHYGYIPDGEFIKVEIIFDFDHAEIDIITKVNENDGSEWLASSSIDSWWSMTNYEPSFNVPHIYSFREARHISTNMESSAASSDAEAFLSVRPVITVKK